MHKSASVIQPFPPSNLRPYKWEDHKDEPRFDAEKHLVPFDVDTLKATSTSMEHIFSSCYPPFELPNELNGKFGFSETFRVRTVFICLFVCFSFFLFEVFSDEGLQVADRILKREYENGFVLPDVRIQLCLRGVSYRSSFLRDFSESCELKDLACGLTGENLIIHPMISNQV
jgi:hypothetical protein